MNKILLKKMMLTALLTAMGYVVTAFLPFAYPCGIGFFNFGDVFTLFGAVVIGPWYGAFIGIIAGSMGDLTAGFAAFIPFTIAAKAIMAIVTGYLVKLKVFKNKLKIIPMLIGGILMASVYLINYLIYTPGTPAFVAYGMDLLQVSISAILAYVIILFINEAYLKLHGETLFNS